MATLRGIIVRLKTGKTLFAGTDDHLYVGVSGTGGGREFPLDVKWSDDFERGATAKYWLGHVWDEEAKVGARRSVDSEGGWNDPLTAFIDFDRVDRVYLRKHAGRRASTDDAYQLDEIEVLLFGDSPQRRAFHCTTQSWLGVEYGLQVWLPEVE